MPLETLNDPAERAEHIESGALERLRASIAAANNYELRTIEHALIDLSLVIAAERMRRLGTKGEDG